MYKMFALMEQDFLEFARAFDTSLRLIDDEFGLYANTKSGCWGVSWWHGTS